MATTTDKGAAAATEQTAAGIISPPPLPLDGYLYLEDEDVKVPLESTLVNIGAGINKALPNTVADRLARPSMIAGLKAGKIVIKTLKVSKIGWPMRRFVEKTRNHRSIVKYYDVDKNVEIGFIEASSIVSVQKIESYKKKIQHVFQIVTPQRRYVLAAATEAELEHWYNGFRRLMQQAESQRPSLGAARASGNRSTIPASGSAPSVTSTQLSSSSPSSAGSISTSSTGTPTGSGASAGSDDGSSAESAPLAGSVSNSSQASSAAASSPAPPSIASVLVSSAGVVAPLASKSGVSAVRSAVDDPTMLKLIGAALGVAALAILFRLLFSLL